MTRKSAPRDRSEPWLDLGLTERQEEVLALACEAKTNLAIGKKLGITEGVVKLHMTAILKALKVQNRAEAILLASRLKSINRRQVRQAEGGKLELDWLIGHMTHLRLPKGTVLFRMGDSGSELFYLQRGKILLEEIASEMTDGTMFGESSLIGDGRPEHGNRSVRRDGAHARKNFVREWFTRHARVVNIRTCAQSPTVLFLMM